jgi:hypothetical protein
MIGKTVDISVTSVLQTTAGKMIFGKFDERALTMPRPVEHRTDVRKSGPTTTTTAAVETAKPE